MKKHILAAAIASTIASPVALAAVDNYELRVSTNVVNGDWNSIPITYTDWENVGNHYDCDAWRPDPTEVDFGQSYLQSRTCQQDQEREAIFKEKHTATGEIQEVRRVIEYQHIAEDVSKVATGERRDWNPTTSTFTEWLDVSDNHSHTAWAPASDAQIQDYNQTRSYKVTQERYEQAREMDAVTGDIRDVGVPTLRNRDDGRSESRAVDVTVSDWENTSAKVCGAWSPTPATVDFGQSFIQTRVCDQNQDRAWSHDVEGTEIHNRVETRVNTFEETQQATGERRDWQPMPSTFTTWTNIGSHKNFTVWSPAITDQETNFAQTRNYDQDQQRFEQKREQDQVTSDIRDVGDPIAHIQTISGTETRTLDVAVGAWTDDSVHYACSDWSPTPDTVDYNQTFTQTRDCSQDQTRSRIYKDGAITVDNQTDARTITETESQQAIGSFRNWESTTPTFTAWTNDGDRYGHSAWSPVANAQTGAFTQNRSYSQDQDRYEQQRERDSVTGDIRDVGEPILREKTISGTESRSVTVSWSSWVNNGGDQNCGAWGPNPETVNYGETFTQNRQCDEPEKRTRTYTSGGSTIHTAQETRLNEVTRTQQETGSKRDWQPTSSTYTSWMNGGARYNHAAWSPSPTTQTAAFTQTRSYSQDQDRYEQKREKDAVTGDIRAVGEPILLEQTITGSESRNVTVSWSSWVNNGADQSCGTWSPAVSTVNYGQTFTQSRQCSEPEKRTRTYTSGGSMIHTAQETRLSEVTREQQATGTKRDWQPIASTYTSWTDTGSAYDHGTWSPAPTTQTAGFTQTRSYSHDQTRTEQKREQDAVTGDIRNTGEPIQHTQTDSRSESRSVTVSWTNWTDVGSHKNCGSWGPDPSTVNYGESFTQTRDCDQDQTRSRVYKVSNSTIHTVAENRTISETVSQAATGTKRDWQPIASTYTSWTDTGSAYDHGTWSPAPTTQTAGFTQTRSYSHDQTRTEQKREQDAVTGDIRNTGEPIQHTQTVSRSQNRNVAVSWSSWVNNGADQNCGTWSPATSTVNYGQSFTQTRNCDEPEKRSRIYKVGASTIYTAQETRLNEVTRSQNATGTKRNWEPMTASSTAWSNSGSGYGYSSWSPAASSQTSDFAQTRSYSQDQTRTVQQREYDTVTGDTRNVGSPTTETRTVTNSESRTVDVSVSSYSNSGSPHSCSAWTPDPSTVNTGQAFTQTRSCSQNQVRTWTYKAGTTTINTRNESRTISVDQSQSATGTKVVEECRYESGYKVIDDESYYKDEYYWGGTALSSTNTGGYQYYKGGKRTNYQNHWGDFIQEYDICRVPN